jgi:hypothetical protein
VIFVKKKTKTNYPGNWQAAAAVSGGGGERRWRCGHTTWGKKQN